MNGRVRTGAFPHEREQRKMRFNPAFDWKRLFDPRLNSDCRCANLDESEISPWVALSSLKNWDSRCINPQGFPDGETGCHESPFVPIDEMIACDIFGKPLDEWEWGSESDFNNHGDILPLEEGRDDPLSQNY